MISVREPEPADADAVADLLQTFTTNNPSPAPTACDGAVPQLIRSKPEGTIAFVAAAEDSVIGLAVASVVPSWVHGEDVIAFLTLLVVSENWRRRGIGTRLVRKVRRWAEVQNAYKVLVEVRTDNAPAISLYERENFAQVGDAWADYLK